MKLKFIGNGSAFNFKNGNNCAFYKEKDKVLFLDFGESVLNTVANSNLLDGVKEIYVANTHLHGDHVGSLETFILYALFEKGIRVQIVKSDYPQKDMALKTLLKMQGANSSHYDFCDANLNNAFSNIKKLTFNQVSHTPALEASYAVQLDFNDGTKIYYSGDTNDQNYIKNVVSRMNSHDEFYCDTCIEDYPGNVHCHIEVLNKLVPQNKRKQVYCMHLDSEKVVEKINEYGFNLTTIN